MQKPKYEAQIPDAASLSSRKSATATDQWLRRRQCVDLWFDMPAKRSPSTLSSSEVKDGEGGWGRDEMSDRETKASLKCLAVCTVPDILKIKEPSQNPSTRCSHSSRESSVPTRPSSRDSRGFCDSCSPEWFTTQRRRGDKNTQIYLDHIRDDLPSRTKIYNSSLGLCRQNYVWVLTLVPKKGTHPPERRTAAAQDWRLSKAAYDEHPVEVASTRCRLTIKTLVNFSIIQSDAELVSLPAVPKPQNDQISRATHGQREAQSTDGKWLTPQLHHEGTGLGLVRKEANPPLSIFCSYS